VVKYRKIPPTAAANQIAENARIPPAADLQKNNIQFFLDNCYLFWCTFVPKIDQKLTSQKAKASLKLYKTSRTKTCLF
jgi:hypothetical protein